MNYATAYKTLFNAITDSIQKIECSYIITQEMEEGIETLKQAQQQTEDMYINDNESE